MDPCYGLHTLFAEKLREKQTYSQSSDNVGAGVFGPSGKEYLLSLVYICCMRVNI